MLFQNFEQTQSFELADGREDAFLSIGQLQQLVLHEHLVLEQHPAKPRVYYASHRQRVEAHVTFLLLYRKRV